MTSDAMTAILAAGSSIALPDSDRIAERRANTSAAAGILDLHDRSLAGWSMSNRQTADIVVNALVMALARRRPDGDLIHHADRGPQSGLNRWSQHRPVGGSVGAPRRLRQGSSSRGPCEGGC